MKQNNNTTRTRPAHWADEAALRVIREKGEKDLYTCASGITPSGTVHIGNFREIISVELVVRALRDMGKNARFIYSWDDYDVFRKVPENMPNKDELSNYLRRPITVVPDPYGREESYARHNEAEIENALPRVGIKPDFLYQAAKYKASEYAEGMRLALEKRSELKKILNKFRDDEHKIQGEWWPVSVFCKICNKDETQIDDWDGELNLLSYTCNACGYKDTVNLRETSVVKLLWRVDWPMRWEHEKVDFEPAGKEHHSPGGSFDTARDISKEIYAWEAPSSFKYDFISLKGMSGKMSSSKGDVVNLDELLKVYTPELVRYIFVGTKPNTEFTISFDLDVIKIYEDYDKCERIALKLEAAKDEQTYLREKRIYELSQVKTDAEGRTLPLSTVPVQVPFRHLCNLIQIADGDIDKALTALAGERSEGGTAPSLAAGQLSAEQVSALRSRAVCAKFWAENYAPEDFRFKLRSAGEEIPAELNDAEKEAVRSLRDNVISCIDTFTDDKTCSQAIYKVAEEQAMEGKVLFRAAYLALIGKEQGPRLASFLRTIDKERLLGILSKY